MNIYSPWEHELERILNRNHYENPNLNIHNAAYTIMFMVSVFNIVDSPLLFSKESLLACSDKFSIKFLKLFPYTSIHIICTDFEK